MAYYTINNQEQGTCSFVCDTKTDIPSGDHIKMGSTAYVVATGEIYVINSEGTWYLFDRGVGGAGSQSEASLNLEIVATTSSDMEDYTVNDQGSYYTYSTTSITLSEEYETINNAIKAGKHVYIRCDKPFASDAIFQLIRHVDGGVIAFSVSSHTLGLEHKMTSATITIDPEHDTVFTLGDLMLDYNSSPSVVG